MTVAAAQASDRTRLIGRLPLKRTEHEKKYNIAYIPGDGIGKETGPEGVRVLEAAARKFGIEFKFDEFDWSCDYYAKHGRMMPEDGLEQVRRHDAVFFRRGGLAGHGARSHFAVGAADPVSAAISSST